MTELVTPRMDVAGSEDAPVRYVRSPYVVRAGERNGRPVVAHRASGRQFVVGTTAYELLQALERPTGLSDLQGWAASHRLADTRQLEGILADLTARALVLEERGGRVRDGAHVTLPARRLFNAAPFDPAVDRGATVLLGVPFGAGNGSSSATANAPAAVRGLANGLGLDLQRTESLAGIRSLFDTDADEDGAGPGLAAGARRILDWGDLYVPRREFADVTYDKLYAVANTALRADSRLFAIGGDHSITYPLLRACTERHPGVHLIHVDAHTDSYDGASAAMLEGSPAFHHGNFVKLALDQLAGLDDVHQFAVRGVGNAGIGHLERQSIHGMRATRRIAAGDEAWSIPTGSPCYLTVDVDALEPYVAPGTATPIPGGLSLRELLTLLARLTAGRRVVGLDIVELNPERDAGGATTAIVTELLVYLLDRLDHAGTAQE